MRAANLRNRGIKLRRAKEKRQRALEKRAADHLNFNICFDITRRRKPQAVTGGDFPPWGSGAGGAGKALLGSLKTASQEIEDLHFLIKEGPFSDRIIKGIEAANFPGNIFIHKGDYVEKDTLVKLEAAPIPLVTVPQGVFNYNIEFSGRRRALSRAEIDSIKVHEKE